MGLDGLREADIGERVLVPAVHLRVVGQGAQLLQRGVHLLRRAFEDAAAAAGEERVATEESTAPIIGNVRARVSRDAEHGKARAELGEGHGVALGDRPREGGDRLAPRPVHRDREMLQQARDAPDVVGMVMRGEHRRERELLSREIIQHRLRVAGVDDRGVRRVAQRPDVVVLERPDRSDLITDFGEHRAAVLRAIRIAKV
jgi:hypothetical protein